MSCSRSQRCRAGGSSAAASARTRYAERLCPRMSNAHPWRRHRARSTQKVDLGLSWSEAALPERERTKHVHRLHPYLGKFIPQLVETLLGRYVKQGGRVLDPFAGSGTTLVQSLESGSTRRSRHCRLQLPVDARQDTAAQPRGAPSRPSLGARAGRGLRGARAYPGDASATSVSGTRRAPRRSCFTSARSSSRSARRTSCVWSSRARRGRPAVRRTSTSSFPASPRWIRTGASSTGVSAARSRRRAGSCFATRSTRSSGSRRSRRFAAAGRLAEVLHGDARTVDSAARSTRSSPRRRTRA